MYSLVSIDSSHSLLGDYLSSSGDEDEEISLEEEDDSPLLQGEKNLTKSWDLYLSEEISKLFGHSPLVPDASQTFFDLNDDRVWKEGIQGIYRGELDYKLRRSGYGLMVYKNGDAYLGNWAKDEVRGNGILLDFSKDVIYIGYWESVSKMKKWLSLPHEVTHLTTKKVKSNLSKAIKTFRILNNLR